MNSNPFSQLPRPPPYNPGPPPPGPSSSTASYTGYWSTPSAQPNTQGPAAAQFSSPPNGSVDQNSLYANYGYGPQWQRQQQPPFVLPPPGLMHPTTYNPFQPQISPQAFQPNVQPAFVQTFAPQYRPPLPPHPPPQAPSAMQFLSTPQAPQQPTAFSQPPRGPPLKRARRDSLQPPSHPRSQGTPAPSQTHPSVPVHGARGAYAGANQTPLGGRGSVTTQSSLISGRGTGNPSGLRGLPSAPRSKLGRPMAPQHGPGSRGAFGGTMAGRMHMKGSNHTQGRRSAALQSHSGKPKNPTSARLTEEQHKDSHLSSTKDLRKDEKRRSLTDFKLVGWCIPELSWSWGTCPGSHSNTSDEKDKLEMRADKSDEDHDMDLGCSRTAPEKNEGKLLSKSKDRARIPHEPNSRVRFYFQTPSEEDAQNSNLPGKTTTLSVKRKKSEDDDEFPERNIRPRQSSLAPSVDMGILDDMRPGLAIGDLGAASTPDTEDGDWLMAAIGEDPEGEDSMCSIGRTGLQGVECKVSGGKPLPVPNAVADEMPPSVSTEEPSVDGPIEPVISAEPGSNEPPKEEVNLDLNVQGMMSAESSKAEDVGTVRVHKDSVGEHETSRVSRSGSPKRLLGEADGRVPDGAHKDVSSKGSPGGVTENLLLSPMDHSITVMSTDPDSMVNPQVSNTSNASLERDGISDHTGSILFEPASPRKKALSLESPSLSQDSRSSTLFGSSASLSHSNDNPISEGKEGIDLPIASEANTSKSTSTSDLSSSNRLSILYAGSQRRLVVEASTIKQIKLFRKDGRLEAWLSLDRDEEETGFKGISLEAYSDSSDIFSSVKLSCDAQLDDASPPLHKSKESAIHVVIFLDVEKPLSEPGWCKSGNVEDWLRKEFGRSNLTGDWENKIEVVDPDPPLTMLNLIETWCGRSQNGTHDERERFRKTYATEPEFIFEILLRLVRGDRNVPAASSRGVFSGPLLDALEVSSIQASQQTHASLAMLAVANIAIDYAVKLDGPTGKDRVTNRIAEIIQHFPVPQFQRALDSIFRDWRASKKGGFRMH